MSNYERSEKIANDVAKVVLVIWGILSIILALMAVGISKELIPYIMGIAALLALPAIVIDELLRELIEDRFWRKEFEKEKEAD